MLLAVSNLRCFERNIDQILSDRTGECPLEICKILLRLIFRHHAKALAELCNDFLLSIDIAAADYSHIAAVAAQMTPQLTNFLIIHRDSSLM